MSLAATVTPELLGTAQRAPAGHMRRLSLSLGTMGASELLNRATRVLTAVCLAHALTPRDFGLAAVTLTTWELMRVLTATGLDARILQCSDESLEQVCRTSYVLNWALYIVVGTLQLAAAVPVALAYGDLKIAWLLAALAIPYAVYPWVAVQACRLQREQRTHITAGMIAMMISGDNILTAAMALTGCGLWSIVVPKIIVSLLWVGLYRRLSSWRPQGPIDWQGAGRTLRFGATILATEIVNTLRFQGDKLIVGQMLGLESLGTYYFAFNAGLGIMWGIVNAFAVALLPHFTRTIGASWSRSDFWRPVLLVSALALPLIVVQTAAAPIYVPLVFGQRWAHAVPVLMLLCLSGIMMPAWRALGQFIRSRGAPGVELAINGTYAAVSLGAVAFGARFGLESVAIAQLGAALVTVPLLTFAALRWLEHRKQGVES